MSKTKIIETVIVAVTALLTVVKAIIKFVEQVNKLRTKPETCTA